MGRSRARTYAKRRRRRVRAAGNDLTPAQWSDLVTAWAGCAYCGITGKPLQRDCVQPIAHGGRYTLDNVVPACRSCNASKCESEVTTWLRRKKLDEAAFLTKFVAIRSEAAQRAVA